MGLLDKLKPQPRWKHADPAVRLEALKELDDPIELAAMAETDPEAKVRRAVVAKIADAELLGRISGQDPDADIRDRASERLLAMATAAGADGAVALAAAQHLSDPRRLSTVAKSQAADAVRASALERITDERGLGSIARHAAHESTALAALERLTSTDELTDVALNSEHKDVALRAFERVAGDSADVALLRSFESRAQQKTVVKRARALVQAIEDAEAARVAAAEERQRQQSALLESVERLADLAADTSLIKTELTRLSDAWDAMAVSDAAARERFSEGVSAANAAIARKQREAEEAAEQARARAEAIATADALCARVETLEGDDVLVQLVPIEEEWRSLSPLVGIGPEADRLAERFAKAVAACRKRHEQGAMLAETRARLEALVDEAERLSSQSDAGATAARWLALDRETRGLAAVLQDAGRPADDLMARLGAVADRVAAQETARRDAAAKTHQEFIGRLQRLIERASRAAEAETITLREGERLMRDLGTAFEELGKADRANKDAKDVEDAAARLRTLQEAVAPRVRDLREMDEWRRFANAQQQEKLIAMAEAIVSSLKSDEEAGKDSDLAATARALKELHAKWGEVAEAPRQSAQKLWDRFRGATDFIRARCEGYFAKLREERGANLERKTAIVEEAEALSTSTDWAKSMARLQELQAEWQKLGPVPRDAAKDLAHRFRTACNLFFARRRDDLMSRKKVWTDNLSRKEALCERAEALAVSTEWDTAVAEMKRLQNEWKTIGPVRRNKSEVIWNRFRAAADQFFERYHNRHQLALMAKLGEREALVVELEGLANAEAGDLQPDAVEKIQQLRTTWNRSVPIPAAEMRALDDRWQQAFARILERWPDALRGSDLDPALILQRMEKLTSRVEALVATTREEPQGTSQTEILAARLRSALASNAMGGRVNDDAKWRAAADTVKDAQAAWSRLAPLATPEARALESRFREAARRVMDHARRHTAGGGRDRNDRNDRNDRGNRSDRRPPRQTVQAGA